MRHAFLLMFLLGCAMLSSQGMAENIDKRELQTIMHDGVKRSYLVRAAHIPTKPGLPIPLVIVLHGGGGNAAITERMTGFTKKPSKNNSLWFTQMAAVISRTNYSHGTHGTAVVMPWKRM